MSRLRPSNRSASLALPHNRHCGSYAQLLTLRNFLRAPRHESCELAFERLGHAVVPTRRDGLGRGVGEDILLAFFQAIEDAHRRGLGRSLRYLEAAVHICVDWAQHHGMDRYAFA